MTKSRDAHSRRIILLRSCQASMRPRERLHVDYTREAFNRLLDVSQFRLQETKCPLARRLQDPTRRINVISLVLEHEFKPHGKIIQRGLGGADFDHRSK